MKDLKYIAEQLRKPSGDFSSTIAEKMNIGNNPLYDLTISSIDLSEGDKVLEIGFGNGYHFENFLSLKKDITLYGIDYSTDMVDQAAAKNKTLVDKKQLFLTEGNSNNLPFDNGMFDKVFCNMVIYFWENPEDHLNEISRVLKPNGKFYTGMRTKKSMLELPFTKFNFNLYTVDFWLSLLEDHKFNVTEINRKKDPAFDDFDKLVQLESICIEAVKS